MRMTLILAWLLVITGCGDSTRLATVTAPSRTASNSKVSVSPTALQAEGPILWEERRKLTWSDFLGTPDPTSPYLAFSQVGSTEIASVVRLPDGSVEIVGGKTIFDGSRSWVLSEGQTDALLEHEQGHFDLEESITREFRAAITKAAAHEEGDKLRSTVARLVEKFTKQSNRLHDRYDQDTDHGQDAKKQSMWDEKISKALGPDPALPPCSPGAVRWSVNGNCYEAVLAPGLSWADAQAACQSRGGHLATVGSAEEDAFVQSLFAANSEFWFVDGFNNGLGPWIGGYQTPGSAEPSGGWSWITGENWSYTNWSAGEPNNCCGGQDKLRYFKPGNTGPVGWDDCETANPTSHRRGYIFESN